ncbi:MAG: cobalamin biosynthesis protein CbiG [Chromatiaceae bacterium]|nr:MAG: cobalamin biosynthesis protein CbiG [Chromatiaceae bacterium]
MTAGTAAQSTADAAAGATPRIAILTLTRGGLWLARTRLQPLLPTARLWAPRRLHITESAVAAGMGPTPGSMPEAASGAASGPVVDWFDGRLADLVARLFPHLDALIGVCALGILVRVIAPLLRDKRRDPAVLALDEAGQFVVPVVGGHLRGANALARQLAAGLGTAADGRAAIAVISTASDVQGNLALDLLGQELGWQLRASPSALLRASAALVNGAAVALVQRDGSRDWWHHHAGGRSGPLPANLHCLDDPAGFVPGRYQALLWIAHEPPPAELAARPPTARSGSADAPGGGAAVVPERAPTGAPAAGVAVIWYRPPA